LWPCYVDPAQLQTALLNLALNGRDAMPKTGMLQIELRNVNLDEDTMAEIPAGSYVRISVRDTGYGMAPDVLARAFEPFFTTKPVGKGTGLGLSMVYGFVRQSGGHVAIESTVGVGTTVSLYLPRSTKLPTVEARVAEPNEVTIGSGRVLLVEDDHNILDVTTTMLTKLGYQVFSARNGTEALHTLRNDRNFDILFSDIVMPQGINGIELAREAKQLCTGLKILLMSGNAADALAWTAAVDEFPIIGKPFRRAELAQFLRVMTRDS
jgi:CheY-like chemotaxis protein